MLEKILHGTTPKENILKNLTQLLEIIPEIKPMINFEHKNPNHNLDVFNHTLKALELSEDNFLLRTVLLLHDIGKPYVYTEINNIRHYKGHEQKSKELAYIILTRLNYNKNFINQVCTLIEKHDTLLTENKIKENPEEAKLILKIQYCDAYAHHPNTYKKREEYLNKMNKIIEKQQINIVKSKRKIKTI